MSLQALVGIPRLRGPPFGSFPFFLWKSQPWGRLRRRPQEGISAPTYPTSPQYVGWDFATHIFPVAPICGLGFRHPHIPLRGVFAGRCGYDVDAMWMRCGYDVGEEIPTLMRDDEGGEIPTLMH